MILRTVFEGRREVGDVTSKQYWRQGSIRELCKVHRVLDRRNSLTL